MLIAEFTLQFPVSDSLLTLVKQYETMAGWLLPPLALLGGGSAVTL